MEHRRNEEIVVYRYFSFQEIPKPICLIMPSNLINKCISVTFEWTGVLSKLNIELVCFLSLCLNAIRYTNPSLYLKDAFIFVYDK